MKRVCSFFLIFCFLFSCSGNALAADAETRASLTLSSYGCSPAQGDNSGQINFYYNITATNVADRIGISKIKIYQANGVYVTTITGTTSNGLIASGTHKHMDVYTYYGIPGMSYYADLTVTATINGVTDSKPYTTRAVQAPY